jgi:hypothetical protein
MYHLILNFLMNVISLMDFVRVSFVVIVNKRKKMWHLQEWILVLPLRHDLHVNTVIHMRHKSSVDYLQGQEINRSRNLPGSKEEEENRKSRRIRRRNRHVISIATRKGSRHFLRVSALYRNAHDFGRTRRSNEHVRKGANAYFFIRRLFTTIFNIYIYYAYTVGIYFYY